jgi:hypothetical protein
MILARYLILLCLCLVAIPGYSQGFSSASQTGMGNVRFFSTYSAQSAFVNPSQLMLADRDERWSISLFSTALFNDYGFSRKGVSSPASYLSPFFSMGDLGDYFTEYDSDNLSKAWFGEINQNSFQHTELDVVTLGLLIKRNDFAVALNHRLRGTSMSLIDRGWYDPSFRIQDNIAVLKRNLEQYSSFHHEISLGFAWEQGLISGLIGNRSAIYVGANPKLILPVSYTNASYSSIYTRNSQEFNTFNSIQTLSIKSAGQPCNSGFNITNECLQKAPDWTSLSGFGIGFDAGITWRFSFGEQIKLRSDLRPVSNYQLSVSVAVTDIGFLHHQSQSYSIDSEEQQLSVQGPITSINREYVKTPLSFYDFVRYDSNSTGIDIPSQSGNISYLTPTTVSAGVGLQLNKLKFAFEYQQVTGNQWESVDDTSFHFGNEIRFLKHLAVRSGFILQHNEPILYTAGIGFDSPWFSLSASAVAKQLDTNQSIRPIIVQVGAMTMRF